jgi:serine/threonine protein kinase
MQYLIIKINHKNENKIKTYFILQMSSKKIFKICGKIHEIFPEDVDQYGYISKLDIKLTETGYILYKGFHTEFTLSKTDDIEHTLIPHSLNNKVKTKQKEILSKGTYGVVYFLPKENIVVKKDKRNDIIDSTMINEICIYRYLDNMEYFPELYNFNFFRNNIELYLEKGKKNLHHHMYKNPEMKLDEIRNISLDIFKGIRYCSEKGIYHCDVKPENIIFTRGKWKHVDFGLSVYDIRKSPRLKHCCIQSWSYRAPEIIAEKNFYDGKIDVFSLGIILFEMACDKKMYTQPPTQNDSVIFLLSIYGYSCYLNPHGQLFFNGKPIIQSCRELFSHIYEKDLNTPKKDIIIKNIKKFGVKEPEIIDLLSGILEMYPKNRLSICEALSHPFFKGEWKMEKIPLKTFGNIKDIYPYWEKIGGEVLRTEVFKWLLRINFRFIACPETVENCFILLDKCVSESYRIDNIYNTAFAIYILSLSVYEPSKAGCFGKFVKHSGMEIKKSETEAEIIRLLYFFKGDIIFPTYYGILKKFGVKTLYGYKSFEHYNQADVYKENFGNQIENLIDTDMVIYE